MVVGEIGGIKLAHVKASSVGGDEFVYWTRLALELVDRVDPRRMARIRRELDYIVNTELAVAANYAPGRICQVDFGRIDFNNQPEWQVSMLAAAIIHEATHGTLFARGLPYTKKNRLRIEKICRDEENRFFSRVKTPWGDELRRPFDPSHWPKRSRGERGQAIWRRIREDRKKGKAPSEPPSRLEILDAGASNGVPFAFVSLAIGGTWRRYRFAVDFEGLEALRRMFELSVSRLTRAEPERFFFVGRVPAPWNLEGPAIAVSVRGDETSRLVTVRVPEDLAGHLSWFAELEDPELATLLEVDDA